MDEQYENYVKYNLDECEQHVKNGLNNYVDVGFALKRIRDGELFKPQYEKFQYYVTERWQMTNPYASRLILAAEVYSRLRGGYPCIFPKNEAITRELVKITPIELQVEAWKKFIDRIPENQITAKKLREFLLENQYIQLKTHKNNSKQAEPEVEMEADASESVSHAVIRHFIDLDPQLFLEEFDKLENSEYQSVKNKLVQLLKLMEA